MATKQSNKLEKFCLFFLNKKRIGESIKMYNNENIRGQI